MDISPAVAEHVMRLAQSHGAVPKAQCTKAISAILAQTPGFDGTPQTWYLREAMAYFGSRPGVTTRRITDDDADDNRRLLAAQHGG